LSTSSVVEPLGTSSRLMRNDDAAEIVGTYESTSLTVKLSGSTARFGTPAAIVTSSVTVATPYGSIVPTFVTPPFAKVIAGFVLVTLTLVLVSGSTPTFLMRTVSLPDSPESSTPSASHDLIESSSFASTNERLPATAKLSTASFSDVDVVGGATAPV